MLIELESRQAELIDLEPVTEIRRVFAGHLVSMADAITQAESEGNDASGQLGLQPVAAELEGTAETLNNGTFRLMVLGDMKRGKSTFLNALLGESILPSDVNPCTAVLTVLRYGERPGVTVHFSDGKEPQRLDVETFRREYTIPPDEAERLAGEGRQAFPDVAYAVLEVPLPLLQRGVEIIDSPGLNDTEARNDLSLGYIRECHAILFVLSATQQVTLGEERYLTTYIRDRGLSVFFVINLWDEIARRLTDPDDPRALAEAEARVRKVFRTKLHRYCRVDGQDLFNRRVFEISALQALRARLAGRSLEGTGFAAFVDALSSFLVRERAAAELGVARTAARGGHQHVRRAVETRIPLLYLPAEELQKKIAAVEPEFRKLEQIRERLMRDIDEARRRRASELSTAFYAHVLQLAARFPEEFTSYQPELKFLDFLRRKERERFAAALEDAFGKYLNDKVMEWSRAADAELQREIASITKVASAYALSYGEVTHTIAAQLLGQRKETSETAAIGDAPGWERFVAGLGAVLVGDLAGGVLAGMGVFNWKRIAANVAGVLVFAVISVLFFGIALTPLGLALVGLGLAPGQLFRAKGKMIQTMKEALEKSIPELALEGRRLVYEKVDGSFSTYMAEIDARVSADIQARRAELDNLVAKKRERDIDVRTETDRLRLLERAVSSEREAIESEYDRFVEHA
jgi:GTPase SAR1 family protein